jgi:hypothetical protein
MPKPLVVVSIDTEEEGLWSSIYRATDNSCRNIERLPRLHAVLRRLGVKPTYLVDHPVVTDARACAVLREICADGASEIGAHLHPWCTPPLLPGGTRPVATFPHQLPVPVQVAKLRALRSAIHERLGVWTTSYRAGRWGFDHSTVPVLELLGFTVDSSVRPLWWDPSRGGPSFMRAPTAPYRLDAANASRPGSSAIVEVPVTAGFVGRHAATWERVTRLMLPAPGLRRIAERLGCRSLLPERHTLPEMCRLTDELAARGAPLFNITFHSSALLPGATPYTREARDCERFVARIEALLVHVLDRHGAQPATLSEVPALLAEERPLATAPDWLRAAVDGVSSSHG